LADHRFRAFLHSFQLVLPVTLEGCGPLVKRAYRFGVGPVQLLAALAAHPNQPHVVQHAQVLGDGRLREAEGSHNLSDGPLGSGKIAQNLPPAGLSNRVEGI
jgi:23S rRNA G2445 N2-methylase RlmL